MQSSEIRTDTRTVFKFLHPDGHCSGQTPGHLLSFDLLFMDIEKVEGYGLPSLDGGIAVLYPTGEFD